MGRKKKDDLMQLELIPLTEVEQLRKDFNEVKESSDKVRRGIFAKNTDLAKKVDTLTCQIESLQKQLITMSDWMLTRIGYVSTVHSQPDGNLGDTMSLRITPVNVEHAGKLHRLHIQEISATLILSA
jgi:hypothetical protein